MNIRDLQYLIAVHDLKNFSKAAEHCFVSQPTLSGQLKKMEEELGAQLIERSTRKVIFTYLGEEVVAKARQVLLAVEQIKNLAIQYQDPMSGDFHLGLIPTISPFLLPLIMPVFFSAFPKMNFYLYELQTEELIKKLLKGELDAGVLAKLDWDYPIEEIPLYSEELKLALSSDDALAMDGEKVSLNVLEGRSVLVLEDGHCLRDQALGVCFSSGAQEDQRYQATSMDTLLHMISSGAGMTLVPQLACNEDLAGVTFLNFTAPVPKRDIIMIVRKNAVRVELINKIVDVIADTVPINI